MNDRGKVVGRRQSDSNPIYVDQLERSLKKSESDNAVLECEVNRLQAIIRTQDKEITELRRLQSDVNLQNNQDEGNENE